MSSFQESLANWASILATLLSIIGLLQSKAWLTAISAFCLAAALIVAAYARKERSLLSSAAITIEGRSIDSLNIANLRRTMNKSLIVQEVQRAVTIAGVDLGISAEYHGYCRADKAAVMEFSVDADVHIPFARLSCAGYDLLRDPARAYPIRPLLIGPDGMTKKIAVPFLEPLTNQQPFSMLLDCTLAGCMKAGVDYYAASLSFDQDTVPRSVVRLVFMGDLPAFVRVYEYTASNQVKLIRTLQPRLLDGKRAEYLDVADNVKAQSARIYLFDRPSVSLSRAA
jgi:hypothetical protein